MGRIVQLSDLLDLRKQKQQELKYYTERLEELNKKLYFLQREVDLTNFIIDLIEKEKIMDLRELIKNDSTDKNAD
jgi:hypothetical protein